MYEGNEYSLEELLIKEPLVTELRNSYFVESDPNDFLSPGEQLELAMHGVELRNSCKKGPIVCDAIGFAVTSPEFNGKEKAWADLFTKFRKDHLGETLTNDIVSELVELQRAASEVWRKGMRQNIEEQIYVKARIDEHRSKVRKKQENWLIVEIGVTGTKFKEYFQNEIYDALNRSQFEGIPFEKIPQAIMPHPQSEELLFEIATPSKLVPNREGGPDVQVANDGLTAKARELAHDFSVKMPAGVKQFQIEGHGYQGDVPMFYAAYLMELLEQRIPCSSVETPDSLHLKVGDACAALQRRFNFGKHIELTITDSGLGTEGAYYNITAAFK